MRVITIETKKAEERIYATNCGCDGAVCDEVGIILSQEITVG